MTRQEIWARQQRHKAFAETELGRLYNRAMRATENYWHLDGQADTVSDTRLFKAGKEMKDAQEALSQKLMEIAGV